MAPLPTSTDDARMEWLPTVGIIVGFPVALSAVLVAIGVLTGGPRDE
jgi:hypothetical protein